MPSNDNLLIKKLQGFLKKLNIDYQLQNDKKTNLKVLEVCFDINITVSKGKKRVVSFPLVIYPIQDDFGNIFLRFTVVSFVEKSVKSLPSKAYKELLELNISMPLMKFAFDVDNGIGIRLILDTSLSNLSYANFGNLLQMMADYINVYYPYLLAIQSSNKKQVRRNSK